MTDSLGPQFLTGVEWNRYGLGQKTDSDQYVDPGSPNERRKDTEETARVPLPGMENVSQFYGDKQKTQLSSALGKMQKNAENRPMSGNISFKHTTIGGQPDGSTKHELKAIRSEEPGIPESEIGSMTWNGDTGRVGWFGIDQEHRGIANHMITTAHRIATEHGDVGPTHSEDLSSDSYQLMKHHASSFMPSNTKIYGRTPEEQDAHVAWRRGVYERARALGIPIE